MFWQKIRYWDKSVLLVVFFLLGFSPIIAKAQSQWPMNGGELSLDEYPDSSSTSNLLWIELSLHSDHHRNRRNHVVNGWWGVGEESSGCSPSFRKQLTKSGKLRCAGSMRSLHQLLMATQHSRNHRSRHGQRWSHTLNVKIDQLSPIEVFFDWDDAVRGHFPVLVISSNGDVDKIVRSGFLRLPKIVGGMYVLKGNASLVLNDLGVIRTEGRVLALVMGSHF
jgi:hypothetical protein